MHSKILFLLTQIDLAVLFEKCLMLYLHYIPKRKTWFSPCPWLSSFICLKFCVNLKFDNLGLSILQKGTRTISIRNSEAFKNIAEAQLGRNGEGQFSPEAGGLRKASPPPFYMALLNGQVTKKRPSSLLKGLKGATVPSLLPQLHLWNIEPDYRWIGQLYA